MLEVLEFIFANGWHFAGTCVLLFIAALAIPSSLVSIKHYHGDAE
jgi:hypothetical protein